MIRPGLAAAIVLTLGGCATSSLVLLPDEGGGQGSVAVLEAKGAPTAAVISEGNSRTKLGTATPVARPLGRDGLKKQEAELLTGLPPPARSFVLYFEQGTVTLTPQSLAELDRLKAEIAARSGPEVEVIGHTDTVGGEEDNDRLSQQRAEEVLNWLASQGLDRSIMSAVGRGERELKEPTMDNIGSAANRRVEVNVR
jgi:outer membrane protein OmpA-like peptidoglycan-associated protein